MGVLVPVGGWDERIVPVLDHVHREPLCECLCHCVEVAQHNVSTPPTDGVDHVCVDSCHEEGHGTASLVKNLPGGPMILVAVRRW